MSGGVWKQDSATRRRRERIIIVPAASDESMAQLYIADQVDSGNPLQPGTFAAARSRNSNLKSWNAEGPVWARRTVAATT